MRTNFTSKRPIQPVSLAVAGLAATVLLIAPQASHAATRSCAVQFNVTSSNDVKALQFDVDYAAASASGDMTSPAECSFVAAGTTDVLVNQAGNSATVGWASTTSFDAPGKFVTCRFDVTGADPVAGNFTASVTDASSNPGVPTTATVSAASVSCTQADSCSMVEPATGCKLSTVAAKSTLAFKHDNLVPAKNQAKFKWSHGAETMAPEFADPVGGSATYSFCVYNDGLLVRGYDVPAGGTCNLKPCWKAAGTGFAFKGDVGGIAAIKLKPGIAGKAQVQVQAKSKVGNFINPTIPLLGTVTAQLQMSTGTCFEAEMGVATKNDDLKYAAKGVLP